MSYAAWRITNKNKYELQKQTQVYNEAVAAVG